MAETQQTGFVIEIDGRRITYHCPVSLTRGQGETILFVHGASFNRRVWDHQVAHLAAEHTPIALDLPSHGESGGPVIRRIEEHAALVKAFVDALGLKRIVLVGHSMGGAIAQYYALSYPADVRAVVLVSTSPKFGADPGNQEQQRMEEWRKDPAKYREEEIKVILAPVTDRAIADTLLAWRDANHPDAQEADREACSVWNITERFPTIRQPMLLITGRYDVLLERNREMHQLLSGSRLVELERSGHMMSVEEPEAVVRAIADFVASLPPDAAVSASDTTEARA